MTKQEYRKDIEGYLSANKFSIIEHDPLTLSDELIFALSDNMVLKITNDEDEIRACEKYLRKHSVKLANITKVKVWGDYHIIVLEKLSPLNDSFLKTFRLFKKEVIRFKRMYDFVMFITFNKKKLKFERCTWLFSTTSLEWFKEMYYIHAQANQFGIKNPDGYFNEKNIGFKKGEISSYTIKDSKKPNFFGNLF